MKTLNEHLIDEYNISCNYYETKYNYILTMIDKHNQNKPLKIFKARYNTWQDKKNMLYKELDDINEKINSTYVNLEALLK